MVNVEHDMLYMLYNNNICFMCQQTQDIVCQIIHCVKYITYYVACVFYTVGYTLLYMIHYRPYIVYYMLYSSTLNVECML